MDQAKDRRRCLHNWRSMEIGTITHASLGYELGCCRQPGVDVMGKDEKGVRLFSCSPTIIWIICWSTLQAETSALTSAAEEQTRRCAATVDSHGCLSCTDWVRQSSCATSEWWNATLLTITSMISLFAKDSDKRLSTSLAALMQMIWLTP